MSAVLGFVGRFVFTTALWVYAGWWSMLMLGIAHGVDPVVPPLPFWACFWIVSALSSVLTAHKFIMELRET